MNDHQIRVAMVVNCYFPIVTDTTLRLMLVARQLHSEGIKVDVITKHWFRRWPKKVRTGEATIYRVDAPSRLGLHGSGFARQARQQILSNRTYYSAILFDQFDATATYFGRFRPKNCRKLLMRISSSDFGEGASSSERTQAVLENALETAARYDRVLVSDDRTWQLISGSDERLDIGSTGERFVRADDRTEIGGSELAVSRSIGDRRIARQSLGEASQELMIAPTDRIVVCFCDFESDNAALEFLESMGPLTENRSRLRIWMVGMSACGREIETLVQQRNWQYSVTFVGTFSDVGSILQVADLVVVPGNRQGGSCIQDVCVQQMIPFLSLATPPEEPMIAHSSLAVFPENLPEMKVALRKWYDGAEDIQHDLLRVHNEMIAKDSERSVGGDGRLSMAGCVARAVCRESKVIDA